MELPTLSAWLEAYFRAWVSNDPDDVADLFAEDAVYAVGPFADPWHGRDEIVRRWTSGVQTEVEYEFEPLAVVANTGLAHWRVRARNEGAATRTEWDGILLLRFGDDGRCVEHREWYATRQLEV
jgi:ketosteroid isomerase-like protein